MASTNESILPPGSLVLVSGANGLIGSHTVDQLLLKGYRVRGTVRDVEKQAWLVPFFEARHGKGKVELVQVEDFAKEGCFDEAVKGVSAFAHIATDTTLKADPAAVVLPVKQAIRNALKSAMTEPGLHSFVYTSSSKAAYRPVPNKEFRVTSESWNEDDIKEAWGPNPTPWNVYGCSKAQAEQEAWAFVKENTPHFAFNTILPNFNFGEVLEPKHQNGTTAAWIPGIYGNWWPFLKTTPPQHYVSVVDTARLHVCALTDASIANERLFAFAGPFNWAQIINIMKNARPDLAHKLPEPVNDDRDLSKVENGPAEKLLQERYGKSWTSLEDAVRDGLKGL